LKDMLERKEPDFASLLAEARADGTRAARELEKLATEVNGENLFAAVFAHLVLSPAGTANELTHGAAPSSLRLLAFHLLLFFAAPGHPGLIERANGGTLFLDEISEMRREA
jgi:hypothetical protein